MSPLERWACRAALLAAWILALYVINLLLDGWWAGYISALTVTIWWWLDDAIRNHQRKWRT